MSFKKKAAAFVTAAAMVLSMTACSDTSYVVTADDENLNAGIYIDYMFNAMQNQIYIWQYTGVTENYFDQTIGDKSFSDYLLDTAMDSTKRYAAVEKLFKESGMKISSDDMKDINNSVNDTWEAYSGLYETEGIGKDSIKKILVNAKKEEMLFDYYYGAEGTEAVTKEALQTYMNDNYLRFKSITIYKSAAEDDVTKQAEDEENKLLFEKYKELSSEVSFADFDEIIHQYEEETAAEDAAEEGTEETEGDDSSEGPTDESAPESTEDSSSEDSSAESDDSSEETSDESVETFEGEDEVNSIYIDENGAVYGLPYNEADEYENAWDDIDEDIEDTYDPDDDDSAVLDNPQTGDSEALADDSSKADEEVSSDDEKSDTDSDADSETDSKADADTDSSSEETADTEEEEEDPYEHERLINYGSLEEDTLDTDYGKRLTEIKNAEVDKVITYEDDNAYYIISKGDVSLRTDYLDDETNFDTVLHEDKDDDFDAKIDAVKESISFSINQDAVDRYTPKNVYDRYEDYRKKNSTNA